MKNIIPAILVLALGCKSQNKLKSVVMEIYPSFHDYSTYEIPAKDDTTKMIFKQYQSSQNIDQTLSQSEILVKTEHIRHAKVKELFKIIEAFEDDGKRNEGWTDGITSSIIRNYENSSDTVSIHVPIRNKNEIHYKYLDKFFEIVEEVESYDNQAYFETIKSYFDYGLPIKRINDHPLIYRVWGALTANEEQKLRQLTESIKDEEFVIFDFRNYQGMGSLLYHEFIQLNKRNHHIYFVYDKEMNEDFEYIAAGKIYDSIEKVLIEYERATNNKR